MLHCVFYFLCMDELFISCNLFVLLYSFCIFLHYFVKSKHCTLISLFHVICGNEMKLASNYFLFEQCICKSVNVGPVGHYLFINNWIV